MTGLPESDGWVEGASGGSTGVQQRRASARSHLDGTVTVHIDAQNVVGPGQNISADGVFFVAEGALRVLVEVEGAAGRRRGEVVRVQSMGEGRIGIAVRFV